MNTQPNPIRTEVNRKPKDLAVVTLTFDEASAEACRRCDLCTAKPGPADGESVCTNKMPHSAIMSFLWGSRVEGAMSPPQPAPTEVPESGAGQPSKPRRPRRRRSAKTIERDAAELLAAMAGEKSEDSAPDPFPDDPEASDARGARLVDRTRKAAARLEKAVVDAHGDFDEDACEAFGLEAEDHYVITIPSYAMELLDSGRNLTLAIPKANVMKLVSKSK